MVRLEMDHLAGSFAVNGIDHPAEVEAVRAVDRRVVTHAA
jgi:hypothetical protein